MNVMAMLQQLYEFGSAIPRGEVTTKHRRYCASFRQFVCWVWIIS